MAAHTTPPHPIFQTLEEIITLFQALEKTA
jgi:hypothetical protein